MLPPEIIASTTHQASLTAVFVMFIISVVITLAMEFLRPKPDVEGTRPKGLGDFQFPTATEDRMIPIVWGTMDIKGPNVTWFGNLRTTKVKERVSTGLFSSTTITTAIRYFVGYQIVLCYGPIDRVTQMSVKKRIAFSTPTDPAGDDGVVITIDAPKLLGGTNNGGGIKGDFQIYPGTESQNVSTYLDGSVSTPVPAYRGIAYILSIGAFVGESVAIDPHVFRITRFPNNLGLAGDGHIVRGTIDDGDANPAEVLYELMTNDAFGLGIAPALINIASFTTAGDALSTEGNGWSSITDRAIQGTDLIREVLRQIDGALYEDSGGTWSLKLFRADYVLGDTPIFDETNIVELESFNRQSWSQTQNDVTVAYVDRTKEFIDTSVPAQDTANVLIQGKKVRADMKFMGIKHPDLAAQIAARELRVLSFPIAQVRFKANRDAASLRPGDVIRLTWVPLELVEFVVRVMSIDLGSLNDGEVGISGSQDFWQLPSAQTVMAPSDNTAWEPIIYKGVEPTVFLHRDAPRFANDQTSNALPAVDVTRSRVMSLVSRANTVQQVWFLSIDPDQTGTWPGTFDGLFKIANVYAPTGLLSVSFDKDTNDIATQLDFDNDDLVTEDLAFAADEVTSGRWLVPGGAAGIKLGRNLIMIEGATQEDDEFIGWETITDQGGGVFRLGNLHRGLLDTRPKDHPIGTRLYFVDDNLSNYAVLGISAATFEVGQTVDLYLAPWVFSFSSDHQVDTSTLTEVAFTFTERQARPLPPQNVLVNDGTPVRLGTAVDLDISGGGNLITTWEHNIYSPAEVPDIDDGSTVDGDQDSDIEYDLTFEGRYSGIVWRAETLNDGGTWRTFTWAEATAQTNSGEAGNIPMIQRIKARRKSGALLNPNLEALQEENISTMIDIGGGTNQSIDLDGSTEYLADTTGHLAGFGDTWTVNFWVRPDVNVGGSERELFAVKPGNNVNRMSFGLDDDANGGEWFVRTWTSGAVALKDYRFGSYTSGLWFMVTVTWNGLADTMLVYENGALVTPGSTPVNNTGNMTDTTRAVFAGTDDAFTVATRWQGLMYSHSLYSRALLGAEITSLYNLGNPNTVTPLEDFLNYAGAADLEHYWDFRITDNTGLGQDFGARATALRWNLTDNALNITTADLTATVPV